MAVAAKIGLYPFSLMLRKKDIEVELETLLNEIPNQNLNVKIGGGR